MNITRENIDELNGLIRVVIEKDDYEATVENVLKDYRKKASMPGFRPGKVPSGLINKMYRKAALVDEVNNLLTKNLTKFIIDEKLDILGEPLPNEENQKQINWDNDTSFEFVFDIGFAPEVKISLDKRSKYNLYKIAVSDELIDQQIESYASRFGESKDSDIVEEGGTVRGNISQVDGDLSVDLALISIDVIKDEEIKNLFVGKRIDDEVIFDIKKAYPNNTEIGYLLNIDKDAAEAISGDFKLIIKEIHKFVPASIDADLFAKVYGDDLEIADITAFRAKVAAEIEEVFTPSSDYKFALDTREALLSKTKIEFPIDFLKRWLKAVNKELTAEQIDNEFDHFVTDLKWQVIKENIIKENDLKVSEEEVLQLAREIAASQFRQYGMMNMPQEHLDGFAQRMLAKEDDRNRLYSKKMEDKVMDYVKSKVAIEEKLLSKEEFEKMFEQQ